LSRHGIKAKSKSGYAGVLAPVRSELGHLSVQKLTRRDIDGLIQRLRDGSVARAKGEGRRRKWGARSCNYMLVALSQVFKQLVKDGTVVRNIAEDVDRVPGKPKKFATLHAGTGGMRATSDPEGPQSPCLAPGPVRAAPR
jgi:integrase